MPTCPKCGFKNERPQATDCPKCGLIYAKFQKAQKDEARHISAEQALNDSLRRAIGSDSEEATTFIDFETDKDFRSYPSIEKLSVFFLCFAGVLGLVTIIEIKYVWGVLNQLNASFKMFSNSDFWIILLSVGLLGTLQVAIYLAIGGLLRLGKDIADNTRATRNYLSHIARKMK